MFLNLAKLFGAIKLTNYIPARRAWKKDFAFDPHNDSTTNEERLRDFHAYEAREENKDIRMSDVTYGWLLATANSVKWLKDKDSFNKINVPILMFRANEDMIVRKSSQRKAAEQLKDCKVVQFNNARHDLWLEKDAVFNRLLNKTQEFIEEKVLLVQTQKVVKPLFKEQPHERTTEIRPS